MGARTSGKVSGLRRHGNDASAFFRPFAALRPLFLRMANSEHHRSPGAYGLSLPDLEDASHLLVADAPQWPEWRIDHRVPAPCEASDETEVLGPEQARLRLSGSGWVELDRRLSRSVLVLPSPPSSAEIAHPLLSLTGATTARWRRWCAFHAGALLIDGAVVGILGPKGAGKSSLLAWFALMDDAEVLADDVLVVDAEGTAMAGPRCLDLRRDTAAHFGVGDYLGVIGARERWRLQLPQTCAEAPLAGWIELAWGEEPAKERLSVSAAFQLIARNLALRILPPDPAELLRLAGLPAWRITRPRDFTAMQYMGELLHP
jgi:hypothetical protein